jgi:hypothetical protein
MPNYTYREWFVACECGFEGSTWGWSYDLPFDCPNCTLETFLIDRNPKFGEAPGISGDELHGYEAKHGVCNPDGSPRRFDSKTELYRALNEAGLKIAGDTPGKPYNVQWSGRTKQPERPKPIVKTDA